MQMVSYIAQWHLAALKSEAQGKLGDPFVANTRETMRPTLHADIQATWVCQTYRCALSTRT